MSIECVSINSSSRQHTFAEVECATSRVRRQVLSYFCSSVFPLFRTRRIFFTSPTFHNIMYANNLLAQADTFGKQNRVTSLSWERLGWYGACKMPLYSPERSVLECVLFLKELHTLGAAKIFTPLTEWCKRTWCAMMYFIINFSSHLARDTFALCSGEAKQVYTLSP